MAKTLREWVADLTGTRLRIPAGTRLGSRWSQAEKKYIDAVQPHDVVVEVFVSEAAVCQLAINALRNKSGRSCAGPVEVRVQGGRRKRGGQPS